MEENILKNEVQKGEAKIVDQTINTPNLSQKTNRKSIVMLFIAIVIFTLSFFSYLFSKNSSYKNGRGITKSEKAFSFSQFKTEQAFRQYISESSGLSQITDIRTLELAAPIGLDNTGFGMAEKSIAAAPPIERISQTNVQVAGIDEPDILKAVNDNIYYSQELTYRIMPEIMPQAVEEKSISPLYYGPKTRIIKSFPPSELKQKSMINKGGNLLLDNNILILLSDNKIIGYDVTDREKPVEKWAYETEDGSRVEEARTFSGKLYIVTRTNVGSFTPCPIPLLKNGLVVLPCGDVYRPSTIIPIDSTYTLFLINPLEGIIEKKISFVGSTGSSVVYMSKENIYITFSYYQDLVGIIYKFFTGSGKDLIPEDLIQRIGEIGDYKLKNATKLMEITSLIEEYKASLGSDEKLKFENDFQNRMESFIKDNMRDIQTTGIMKISVDGFNIKAEGQVPGILLNQFSIDEYNGRLRTAVTLGGGMLLGGTGQSANDVYILDDKLKIQGSIKDLGLTERIYSVRFVGDRGYLVTFRQTDPFYVLDLKDPSNPQKSGELKIPGFSSYLHPLDESMVLGVGQEGSQVKLSLFDVSNPSDPIEVSKYNLDEYWSEVQNTHHAFTQDAKNKVFFIPGGKGGYIFSYSNNSINLVKAISETNVKRGLYINNYFYIVGDTKITVLNETDWESVNSLEFEN